MSNLSATPAPPGFRLNNALTNPSGLAPGTPRSRGFDPQMAELILNHYRMQRGRFISEWEEAKGGITIHSEISSAPIWNHSAWLMERPDEFSDFIAQARTRQQSRRRRPTVYLATEFSQDGGEDRMLFEAGYEKFDFESWMLFDKPELFNGAPAGSLKIIQARTEKEMSDFVEVFYESYQIHEPDYASVLKRQVTDPAAAQGVRHFVAYSGAKPLCIATLIQGAGDTCIYNVGTLPGARNRGYAAALMAHLIKEALASGPTRLFLQVTSGSAAERLYLRLGFNVQFTRAGYRLKEWPPQGKIIVAGWRDGVSEQPGPLLLSLLHRDHSSWNLHENARRESVALPRNIVPALNAAARRSSVKPETVLIAAWACLLSRYSGEETVVFGIRPALLQAEGGQEITLPFEVTIPAETVETWLQNLEKLYSPILTGGSAANPKSASNSADPSPEVQFETLVNFRGRDARRSASPLATLELVATEANGDLVSLIYDPGLFEADVIRRMADHLVCLVESMGRQPKGSVSSLEILPHLERENLLVQWNESERRSSADQSIAQLFEAQVAMTPEAIALVWAPEDESQPEKEKLTYGEVNRRVNQLAHYLRSAGVGRDTFVGLCLERSTDMVIAFLAILKAGGAATPLDPAYPFERLAFMVADTRMPVLLTQQHLASKFDSSPTKVICLDAVWEEISCQSGANPEFKRDPEDLAYVIYTSGSTGAPKGVLVSNRSIANHSLDVREYYELKPRDRALQFASMNFDAAIEQILTPLISGACLVLRGNETWNGKEFARQLCNLGLTVIDLPTAYWHRLLHDWAHSPELVSPHQLRLVIVGGEMMLPETLHLWRQTPLRSVRLVNAYGPTEATITATAFEITAAVAEAKFMRRIPIGRPRGKRKAYILDQLQRPVPIGIAGELCLGGEMLARGYLNRPELTKEKFVPDRFSGQTGARLYRTGDLVRYLPDGNIEFLGRVDDQVKIRGFRIELGEIETVLNQHPGVKEAVVAAREEGEGKKRLIAYVVGNGAPSPTGKELRYFLKQKLPEYMAPSAFVMLDALPLTPNGKIDRRALPAPPKTSDESPFVTKGPSEPLELRLRLIFEKVLNRRPIGVDVSFFELGGDSLQALELIVGIERATGRNLPLETLYQCSTIEGLAKILQSQDRSTEWSSLVPLQTSGTRPPFFFIHTTPGDILGYGNLIYHLGSDQPCYGFQSLGLFRSDLSHQRIEDMAAHYVGLLRSFQPQGPYYLGGWCYGGIVAVEMAHQLLSIGEEIALLALLETVAPAPSLRVPQYYFHRLGCVGRMTPGRWMIYLREKIKYHRETQFLNRSRFQQVKEPIQSGPEAKDEKLVRLQHVYEANLKALQRYRSIPYPGRVTLFNAAELDRALIPDRHYGWVGLAAEIEIYTVPGNHDSMLTEPHVSSLAKELQACLRRAQNRSKNLGELACQPPAETPE